MNAVEMRGIVKQYPLVRALDNVNFSVAAGEIHSLLGENGAGKSTLMNVLYGMTQPNAGEIYINGEKVCIQHPSQAIACGIGMVHQHFMLAPIMTVTENMIVGSEPSQGIFVDQKLARKKVTEMIEEYNFGINADAKVQDLSVGQQQRVEILKALYRGANILILDEPTAVLTPQEVDELFRVLRDLKAAGKSIIIITHKLKETAAIADRVSVLRNGVMIDSGLPAKGCTIDQLAQMMVGREVNLSYTDYRDDAGEVVYEVKDLHLNIKKVPVLKGLSLQVRKGQIYGIAGIEGNGQTELIEVLTGLRKADSMILRKDGKDISGNAAKFLEEGIGHIPEDRMSRGLVLPMTIEENIILGYHRRERFAKKGLRKLGEIRKFADEYSKQFQVKAPNVLERCSSLSGGNQQKVVIARVFSEDPDVIIAAQPTRGVDVGAQELIHSRLLELRDAGKAVILISADLDEVRKLSDRIGVIYDGRIVAEAAHDVWDEKQIGLMMTGGSVEGV